MSDRGVSDVLGFLLIFSLISLTVGIVSLTGFAGLQNQQDAGQVNNAERAFEVLANNVEDIYRQGAPRRSTGVELAGAQLNSAEATTVSVTKDNSPLLEEELWPIRYSAPDGTTLVYENGAIIREDPNGKAVVKREPNMVFSDEGGTDTAVIPLIETSEAEENVGGDTTALVRTESSRTEVTRYDDPGTTYEITLRIKTTSERANAWRTYLTEEVGGTYDSSKACDPPVGDTVACIKFSVDRVTVTEIGIRVEFE